MRPILCLVALHLSSALSLAQADARSIIERAILAHGGKEKLTGIRAEKVKLQGKFHIGSSPVSFTNETIVQFPSQFRSVVTLSEVPRDRTVIHLLDGERATILIDGQSQPASGTHLAQLKQTLQLEQAIRLVPLLDESAFQLHVLPQVRYNDRIFHGVRVQGRSQRDLKLFFDGATGLLVKTEHRLDGPGGKEVLQEAFYGEYRDLGGYRRASQVVVLRDGKKVMEATILEARRLDRVDPVEFTRP